MTGRGLNGRVRATMAACALGAGGLVAFAGPAAAAPDHDHDFQNERHGHSSRDARAGRVAPSRTRRAAAERGNARVRFNEFGTPALQVRPDGPLATGLPGDPEAAARAYLRGNAAAFGLSAAAIDGLELVAVNPLGDGAAVLLRQRFGDLRAGVDGLVTVAVRDGEAQFVSSSLTADTDAPPAATLGAREAAAAALREADRPGAASALEARGERGGWEEFAAPGLSDRVRVRAVAVPTPADGVRAAFEVLVLDDGAGDPLGLSVFVDGRTGDVLVREDLVDHLADNPTFRVFENTPPLDYTARDTRATWCFFPGAPSCVRAVRSAASPVAWDVDPRTNYPTFRTQGNAARTTEKWNSNDSAAQGTNYTASPTRDFSFPWTNAWSERRCDPAAFTAPERNDIDAASTNLFAMHNRMHDWSYRLGFTEAAWNLQEANFGRGGAERDPEHGNAQAGGIVGGPPLFLSRDNANQISPPDGIAPTTNMYLWQPIAAGFYSPCVDGDYDLSVIGHEYTHAISNRMVAGPDGRLHRPAGQRDGRVVVGPRRRRAHGRVRPRAGRRREPVGGRPVRHRRRAGWHPQLRDEREPAERSRTSARTSPARRSTPTARSGARRTSTSGPG